ncbi:hypothetical protein BGZ58_000186 [Dissophora ornata]|nr:hypothetical protein BGZ58_000186 [Dissophora ornata]
MLFRRPKGKKYQTQTRLHEEFGKVYTVTVLGFSRMINIRDSAMIEHVLKTQFSKYEKGEFFRTVLEPLIGGGIFGADGQHWRWQRKLASHIFNARALRDYTSDVFCQEAQLVVDYFTKITADPCIETEDGYGDTRKTKKENTILDLQKIFLLFTLDSFSEIAFGQSIGCLENPERPVEFALAFDRMNSNLYKRFCSPFYKWTEWWTGMDQQIERDRKVIYDFAYNVIRRRRESEETDEEENGKQDYHSEVYEGSKSQSRKKRRKDGGKKDLVQLFMDVEDENGEQLSDSALKDILLNFVLAGRDTTAQALSWMFYLIFRPDSCQNIRERLLAEIDSVFPTHSEKDTDTIHPTYETIKSLRYAEACFLESLRLYPSVPHNIRACTEDDILPGGVHIYKGEMVAWSSWAMGRDTATWGADAKEFRPERWLQGDKVSPAKFVAFHMGPRSCLGQQFATVEALTITSMLLRKFTFELVDPHKEPAYQQAVTLPMAEGLPVRVKRRSRAMEV